MQPSSQDNKQFVGERPIDYPATYHRLLRCTCMRTTEQCYIEIEEPWRRYCMRYYRPGTIRCDLKILNAHGYRSQLTQNESIETIIQCFECYKNLIAVKPAGDCERCLVLFLQNEEEIEERFHEQMYGFETFDS